MSQPQEKTPLQSQDTAKEKPLTPKPARGRIIGGILDAFSDWFELLDGPKSKPFTQIIRGKDLNRLLKLLALCISLSAVILGMSASITSFADVPQVVGPQSRPLVAILLAGVIVATAYSSVSRLFGIRIALTKCFFVVLLLWAPWLPVLALFQAIIHFPFPGVFIISTIVPVLILIKPVNNFCRGVSGIAKCSLLRVWISVVIPVVLFVGVVILMYAR